MFVRWVIFALLAVIARAAEPNPLSWDAKEKTLEVKPGDGAAEFVFNVTNTGKAPVEIIQLRPSCGCTVAEMPSNPWILAAGAQGAFSGTIDLRGKRGRVSKNIFVTSTAGTQVLAIVVNIPESPLAQREQNRTLALADRQAVFKGACASCHAAPAEGKLAGDLFNVACGVCHVSDHRAAMVPDLKVARTHRDAEFWRRWISEGKTGTLMPAFAKKAGGPLTDAQIESLVAFAIEELPSDPDPK